MRDRFNEQLEQLNVELIKMGALCEEANLRRHQGPAGRR